MIETQSLKSELIWLNQKKNTLMQQYSKFQKQSLDASEKILDVILIIQKNNIDLNKQIQVERQTSMQEKNTLQKKLKALSGILQSKQKQHECHIKEFNELKQTNQRYQSQLAQIRNENDIQQQTITALKNQIQKISSEYTDKIQVLNIENDENIQSMINKYQSLIENKVKMIANEYQIQLQDLQQKNKRYIEELEAQSKEKMDKNSECLRKNQSDYERILQENRKLMGSLNQNKKKIMNLENQSQTNCQEMKLALKQKEIIVSNLKRQIICLKEDKANAQDKIKRLREEIDQKKWQCRQILIHQQDQIKKISSRNDEQLEGLLKQHKEELKMIKNQYTEVKEQNKVLIAKIQGLRTENESMKEIVKFYKKQRDFLIQTKKSIEPESQKYLDQQTELKKCRNLIAQLKKQVVKKNAQIQILKEQIARVKAKANRVTVAYQQHLKAQQLVQKQNKMLLSEIIFLRDKNKSRVKKAEKENNNSQILDLKSQQSELFENQDLMMYKELITEMEKDMNEAAAKIQQKNTIIQKQKAIIQRLERALNS